MDPILHDLLHALARAEQYLDEQKRWMDIVNKLVNDMVLKGEPNGTGQTGTGSNTERDTESSR